MIFKMQMMNNNLKMRLMINKRNNSILNSRMALVYLLTRKDTMFACLRNGTWKIRLSFNRMIYMKYSLKQTLGMLESLTIC